MLSSKFISLQTAFGWQDYHLHEFLIYASSPYSLNKKDYNQNRRPIEHLVSSKESLAYPSGVPMRLGTGVKLSDVLPCEIMYTYDFGDDWKHSIVVEKFIDDYDVGHPICLDGEGDSPPEDVGGEPGYEAFLETIEDPSNPDYKHMRSWGIRQGYEKFNIEWVNRRLK